MSDSYWTLLDDLRQHDACGSAVGAPIRLAAAAHGRSASRPPVDLEGLQVVADACLRSPVSMEGLRALVPGAPGEKTHEERAATRARDPEMARGGT